MRAVRSLLTILAASLLVSGCQSPKATFERTFLPDPAKPYVGMTKEQIIACAGTPAGRYNTNTGETLVYHYSGAGPVPQAAPKKDRVEASQPVREEEVRQGLRLQREPCVRGRTPHAGNVRAPPRRQSL